MEKWLVAGLWGLLSGSALVMGSLAGYYLNISQKAVAIVMGFGAGVLISALSFELMNEAFKQGGFVAAASFTQSPIISYLRKAASTGNALETSNQLQMKMEVG
jgi:ZIP family zinc transporter